MRVSVFAALAAVATACGGAPTVPSDVPSPPDQVIREFRMDTYARGSLAWSLTAPEARVFDGPQRADLDRPEVRFFADEKPGSVVTAAHGEMNTRSRDMVAGGGVVIVSTEGARLETPWMRYDSQKDLLFSTAAVVITRGRSVVRGVGWSARPDFSEMEVRRQRGEIAPEDERFFRQRP
ncbi:MAG: LPS export ABC transporter periplasmic protein LptC [Elusimicrobia bacterium]|nr:LPS export ABC transporter periplasmic protein LptC [Elusimicrobiota bacterium]